MNAGWKFRYSPRPKRSRIRKARIALSTPQLREMTPTVGKLLAEAGRLVHARMASGATAPSKRARGRGSQLGVVEQLAVMYAGGVYRQNANEIARKFGYSPRTVQRIFRTSAYRKWKDEALHAALGSMLHNRW